MEPTIWRRADPLGYVAGAGTMIAKPWYEGGPRFQCTRCGNCCGGAPGTVRITDAEIPTLAEHLQMTDETFRSVYTRRIGDHDISLKEKSNHECIFYDKSKGCTIYQYRPRQCRTWPFWRSVMKSPASWAKEGTDCPGMNRGALHNRTTIEETMLNDGTFGKT